MTRMFLAGLAASVAITVLSGTGCQSTGVGDPCVPEEEYSTDFLGFTQELVSAESKSYQCQSRLCLVNHFQGRVSCPYGQAGYQMGPGGNVTSWCKTPIGQDVTGTTSGLPNGATDSQGNTVTYADPVNQAKVQPNCANRQAANSVYCSCRCGNVNGKTDDGANYCTCPDGYQCTQLISSIGQSNEGLTGAYCIKANTAYDEQNFACQPCNPATKNCGDPKGVTY